MTRAAFVLALSAAFCAFATSAQAQTAAQDSAVGDVAFFPLATASFDARSGPQGENPTGSVTSNSRGLVVGGPVTCLTVTGNRATIAFENLGEGSPTLRGGFLFVEDNGTPGAGRDNIQAGPLVSAPPTVCPPNTVVYQPGEFGNTIEFGEITVQDAQPSPTSKEQCKRGGWRTFGTAFRNQGQCVDFVERRPKP
jgi:hypothetical protein